MDGRLLTASEAQAVQKSLISEASSRLLRIQEETAELAQKLDSNLTIVLAAAVPPEQCSNEKMEALPSELLTLFEDHIEKARSCNAHLQSILARLRL